MIRNLQTPTLLLAVALCVSSACAQSDFSSIDQIVSHAVDEQQLPGAVVVVGHDGHVVFRRAYGMRSLEPTQETMATDTIFDMASLTKPLTTALAIMQLYEQGNLGLNDPVAKYLPEFGANGKQDITIRHLLTHYSGLPPDLPLGEPWTGKDKGYQLAFGIAPLRPPGEQFLYSDINFIVLGAVSYTHLDVYKRQPPGRTRTSRGGMLAQLCSARMTRPLAQWTSPALRPNVTTCHPSSGEFLAQ